MLGHYSAGFTLDTYAHVTTAAQKAAEPWKGAGERPRKYPKTKRGPGAAEPHPDLAFGSYGSEYGSTPKVQKSVSTFLSNKQGKPSDFKRNQTVLWQGVTIPNPGSIKALRRNGYKTRSHLSHRFSGLFHYKIMPEPIWQKQIGIKTYESASSPDGATFPSIISTTI